jgi:hypothetical protein
VKSSEHELINERGSRDAEMLPMPGGSLRCQGRSDYATMLAQAADEFVILHDWQGSKSAKFLEERAAQEKTLISIRHPEPARTEVHRPLEQIFPPELRVNLKGKRTCRHAWKSQLVCDTGDIIVREQGVSVQE